MALYLINNIDSHSRKQVTFQKATITYDLLCFNGSFHFSDISLQYLVDNCSDNNLRLNPILRFSSYYTNHQRVGRWKVPSQIQYHNAGWIHIWTHLLQFSLNSSKWRLEIELSIDYCATECNMFHSHLLPGGWISLIHCPIQLKTEYWSSELDCRSKLERKARSWWVHIQFR